MLKIFFSSLKFMLVQSICFVALSTCFNIDVAASALEPREQDIARGMSEEGSVTEQQQQQRQQLLREIRQEPSRRAMNRAMERLRSLIAQATDPENIRRLREDARRSLDAMSPDDRHRLIHQHSTFGLGMDCWECGRRLDGPMSDEQFNAMAAEDRRTGSSIY